MNSLVVQRLANTDIAQARDWYLEKSGRAAKNFLNQLSLLFSEIAADPLRFPIEFEDIRIAQMKKYPYSVFFFTKEYDIQIIAVYHHSRDSEGWRSRVGSINPTRK
jgi:toxin ParE1/3/4